MEAQTFVFFSTLSLCVCRCPLCLVLPPPSHPPTLLSAVLYLVTIIGKVGSFEAHAHTHAHVLCRGQGCVLRVSIVLLRPAWVAFSWYRFREKNKHSVTLFSLVHQATLSQQLKRGPSQSVISCFSFSVTLFLTSFSFLFRSSFPFFQLPQPLSEHTLPSLAFSLSGPFFFGGEHSWHLIDDPIYHQRV